MTVDASLFPEVDDFTVRTVEIDAVGYIEFVSAARGRLAWFPAWEHADRDLRHFIAADVPLGTIDEPYEDLDEGWSIVIFEHAGFVYVAEGDRRFRIPTDDYVKAWAALIDRFNPVAPLDA